MSDRVLVLNQDYQAISICSPQRAFTLVYLNKAELVADVNGKLLRSVNRSFSYPSIIRLTKYVRVPHRKVSLTRPNIMRRDNYRCVYCGSTSMLTIDHVIPRSQGGRDSWDNLVTACSICNARKANRSLADSGLTMKQKPGRPSYVLFLNSFNSRLDEGWHSYLMLN